MSMYGSCEKCDHDLERHYVDFCPKCDTSVLEKKIRVFDLYKIMYHMEANGFMSKDKFWEHLCDTNDRIRNDIYINMYIEWDEDKEDQDDFDRYYCELARILNLEYGEKVAMWISW